MKALILNSGVGTRMGVLTSTHPKCMTELSTYETILSRQLKQLQKFSISEIIITTGLFHDILVDYCNSLSLNQNYTFVYNSMFNETNYIYSMFLAKDFLDGDILLMHGDLVFEDHVLEAILKQACSSMAISSTTALPDKDFKAVIENEKISKIGIEFFDNAVAAQPLYKLEKKDWFIWLSEIENFCNNNNVKCYAENAFNQISSACHLHSLDVKDSLCSEIDTPEDWAIVKKKLEVMG